MSNDKESYGSIVLTHSIIDLAIHRNPPLGLQLCYLQSERVFEWHHPQTVGKLAAWSIDCVDEGLELRVK